MKTHPLKMEMIKDGTWMAYKRGSTAFDGIFLMKEGMIKRRSRE